jgi:hypothetical protein
MEGNNEKRYFAIPSCDYSFPCLEWLWAKSVSLCHSSSTHTDICVAYADAHYVDIGAGYAYTACTHTDTCAVYTDTASEDHCRHQHR